MKIKFCKNKPNLFLQLPVDCNFNCIYCTSKRLNRFYSEKEKTVYLESLSNILDDYNFNKVSISGGEPTIDDRFLLRVLELLKIKNVSKIVLHTNGSFLVNKKIRNLINKYVSVLNISMHKGESSFNLKDISIPVTLNIVVDNMPTLDRIKSQILFCKKNGFKSLCYRKEYEADYRNFMKYVETHFKEFKIKEAKSCIGTTTFTWYKIDDFLVTLSTGIKEPNSACGIFNTDKIKYVYCAILYPDAILRYGWNDKYITRKIEDGNYQKYCMSFSNNEKFKINQRI